MPSYRNCITNMICLWCLPYNNNSSTKMFDYM